MVSRSASKAAGSKKSKKARAKSAEFLQKPRGLVHPRVQAVGGPQFFGIVSVDCAKVRSKFMLADFYGNVLVPPTEIEHNRVEFGKEKGTGTDRHLY